MLQEDQVSDAPTCRNALQTAAAEITRTRGTHTEQLREALNYLILLILHRRDATERDAFIDIIKAQSPDETEVDIMAQTAAEALIEQGARQMSIESTLTILARRFPGTDVLRVKSRLEAIADLDRLKLLNLTASIAESFPAFREQLEA